MVAGRSGSQKSGLALFWTAMMNEPTLYITGDMTAFEATTRLVGMQLLEETEQIEEGLEGPDAARYLNALNGSRITLAPMSPITWEGIDDELEAWVELHNAYPKVIVIDNLMDVEDCDSDNVAQKAAMQEITALSREVGSTVIVLHHATDKGDRAKTMPGYPPPRNEILNSVQEKPQLTLTVAFDDASREMRIACVKQRSGRSDPAAEDFIRLAAWPEYTRFAPRGAALPGRAA